MHEMIDNIGIGFLCFIVALLIWKNWGQQDKPEEAKKTARERLIELVQKHDLTLTEGQGGPMISSPQPLSDELCKEIEEAMWEAYEDEKEGTVQDETDTD